MKAAKLAVHEYGISHFTDEIRARFYEVLLNPPAPSAALKALAASPIPPGVVLER